MTREGEGSVQMALLQSLLQASGRYVLRKRRRRNNFLVAIAESERLSRAHVVGRDDREG